MKGLKIFLHSVRMVLGNWKEALQIFLVPMLCFGLCFFLLFGNSFPQLDLEQPENLELGADFALRIFIFFLVSLLLFVWCVVNWHRFVLSEEYPSSWLPKLRSKEMVNYIYKSLILFCVVFLVAIPVIFIAVAFSATPFGLFILFAASLLLSVVVYRIASILPAAAVGRNLTVSEAWNATKGGFFDILALVLVYGLVQWIASFVISSVSSGSETVGFVINIMLSGMIGLVGVSILTSLYGHYVEGRDLD